MKIQKLSISTTGIRNQKEMKSLEKIKSTAAIPIHCLL
jgi:hypothetical protein